MRIALLSMAVAACAPPPPASPEVALRRDVARIRAGASAYLNLQTEQQWRAWIGTPATGDALESYAWLFAPETIDTLRRGMRAEQSAVGRRALHYVHAFLISEHVQRSMRDHELRLAQLFAAPVEVDGQQIAFSDLSAALAREPDPNRRRRITEAVSPLLAEANSILSARDRAITRAGARVGYHDRARLVSEMRSHDVQRAGELARELLTSSDAIYTSALRELAPAVVDVPFDSLRRADVPRLVATPGFADQFPADRLVSAAATTFLELGIDLDRLPLHVDTESNTRKNPRAACFPVHVPTDVRLSIKPSGGPGDYGALLHEMGHALHFTFTRTPLFELQLLGDGSAAEAFAFLFQGLADDAEWLAEHLHINEPRLTDYVRLAALRRLLMVRRQAALLLFELDRRASSEADPRVLYARHLSRAYGFKIEPADAERFWVDSDPFLRSADYLRGWLLAAQLAERLRARFGSNWWRSPAAGDFLKEAWAAGQRDTADELARRLDIQEIDPEPMLGSVANALIRRASLARRHAAGRERAN